MKQRVVLIVTGMPGSGKSIVSEVAKELGFDVVSMGDVIREEVRRRGLPLTKENAMRIACELREKYGSDIVARRTLEKIKKMQSGKVLIDGLRSLSELDLFQRNLGDETKIYIIAVHASPRTRFERLLKRQRPDDPKTWEEFRSRDLKELDFGIGSVIALADIMIVNEGKTIEEVKSEIKNSIEGILGEN